MQPPEPCSSRSFLAGSWLVPGWSGASGPITDVNVTEVFVNPAAPQRALALGVRDDQDMGLPQLAYASEDGAATFGAPIFRATGEVGLLGIESAASDPRVIYLASYAVPNHPALVRSDDAGATWTTVDSSRCSDRGWCASSRSTRAMPAPSSCASDGRRVARPWRCRRTEGGPFAPSSRPAAS
jgi:hypothetical protein